MKDKILANLLKQARSPADLKVTSTEQQESEIQSVTTTTTIRFKKAVIARGAEPQAPANTLTKQATNTATVE